MPVCKAYVTAFTIGIVASGTLAAETPRVVLGGLSGLPSLQDPQATRDFRRIPDTGFYIHFSATDPRLFAPADRKIASIFKGRATIAEVALGGGFNPSFWSTAWKTQVEAYGFTPRFAIVNQAVADVTSEASVSKEEQQQFSEFVTSGRRDGGVEVLAPIASPNQSGGDGQKGDARTLVIAHPWNDQWWDGLKAMAEVGGGIALDAPPAFFLHGLSNGNQIKAYQVFEEDVLKWARREGLWSAEIVSPYFDGLTFEENSKSLYHILSVAGALPETWVLENYSECGSPFPRPCNSTDASFLVPVGSEKQQDTIASVALWFAQHAKARQ